MHPSLKRALNNFLRRPKGQDPQRGGKDKYVSNRHDHGGINTGKTDEEIFKGKDVKEIRRKYNLSQRCFANMLDISIKTLQNYEIDKRNIPSTARSLFIFADENIDLFTKYYLNKVDKLLPYRDSMNKKVYL